MLKLPLRGNKAHEDPRPCGFKAFSEEVGSSSPLKSTTLRKILKFVHWILMILVLFGGTRGWGLLALILWLATVSIVSGIIQRIPSKEVFGTSWSPCQARALLSLCHNKYWSRIWIVQEIVVAQDVVVSCGDRSFKWTQLQQLLQWLDKLYINGHSENYPLASAIYSSPAMVIITFRAIWQPMPNDVKGFPLASILVSHKDMNSTDERDMLYALLGLIHDDELRDLSISVDYSVTREALYVKTLTSFVRCKPWNRNAFEELAVQLLDILNLSSLDTSVNIETRKILGQCHNSSKGHLWNGVTVSIGDSSFDLSSLFAEIVNEHQQQLKKVQKQRENERQQFFRVSLVKHTCVS